jgi:transcriptional regulator with GAF, ATPase, and Fis domain/Tfp pilus assembly protein PilF
LESLEEVGDFHLSSDGFGTALEYYERALVGLQASEAPSPISAARLHRKIADCYRSRGFVQKSAAHLDVAFDHLAGFESDVEFGIALSRRADVRILRGQPERALKDALLAIEVLRSSAEHSEFAYAQTVAAICYGRLGKPDQYEQLNLDALATYRRIEDQVGIANVLNNLGIAYKNSCRWDKAVHSLTQARELSESLGLTRRLSRTLLNLGIVYTKRREFEEAIAVLRRARRLARSLGDQATQVKVMNSLGRALLQAGRYRQAEKYLLEARVTAERHDMPRSQALADEFLGDLMAAQGRLDEARQNYESGLRIARVVAPKGDVVGEILRRVAEIELRSGLRSQSIATARRALRLCTACGETHEIGFIHRTLAEAFAALGKTREANDAYRSSIDSFKATANPYELAQSRLSYARFKLSEHDPASCLTAAREAQLAVDTFRVLEEDCAQCEAGLVLARAHQGAGNHDDGLLTLVEIEHAAEECGSEELLQEVRRLRRQFEMSVVSSTQNMNLFGELYALASQPERVEEQLVEVLRAVCERTQCSGAFLALVPSDEAPPEIKATLSLALEEARDLSRYLLQNDLEAVAWSDHDADFAARFPSVAQRAGAILSQPLRFEGDLVGLLYLERATRLVESDSTLRSFSQDDVAFVSTYVNLAAVVLHELFREALQPTPVPPATSTGNAGDLHPVLSRVITQDTAMRSVLALAARVAKSDCTVLFSGETGTGKGLVAQSVHRMSPRAQKKFISLNCAALPEQLLESELFGHARGAFTGADHQKIGLLEAAHGGTVFLDEVGKTSLFMQGKLLQFLDSSEIRPVGTNEFRKVDVRVICASKVDLRTLVEEGRFLEDLYYRLNDFPLTIPPLRERSGDVPLLVQFYLKRLCDKNGREVPRVLAPVMQRLNSYPWPGNVRELEKVIQRALILTDPGRPMTMAELSADLHEEQQDELSQRTLREHVADLEKRLIETSLSRSGGNKAEAARSLGISYPSLLQKIKQFSLDT